MRAAWLGAALLALSSGGLHAQQAAEAPQVAGGREEVGEPDAGDGAAHGVALAPAWSVGDRYRIELEKSRVVEREGVRVLAGTSSTVIDVEVVDEDDRSFVIEWRFGAITMPEDLPGVDSGFARRTRELAEGSVVRVRTDEYGSVAAVENREQLAALISAMSDAFDAEFSAAAADADGPGLPEGFLSGMFDSVGQDAMIDAMVADMVPYYMASGLLLEPGETFSYETELPNPLGGDPLPATGSWTLVSCDPEAGRAEIAWEQVVDPVRAAEVIQASVRRLARPLARAFGRDDVDPEAEVPPLEVHDRARFVYDLERALPLEVRVTRRAVVADDRRVHVLHYRLLPAADEARAGSTDSVQPADEG